MGGTLLFARTKKILLFVTLLFGVAASGVSGQSVGDIAFTGFNSESPGDGFAVVAFTSFSSGDEVHFSSKEWDGSSFSGSGGDLTWVAPSGGITSGTVLVFEDVEDEPSVNIGSITDDSNMNLSVSGDVIYAYTGTSQDSPDTFLGAIATAAEEYNGGEGTIPSDLSQGSTAILLSDNIDVAQFIGGRSGNTKSGYQTELNDINNWEEANGNGDQSDQILPFDTQNFTLVSAPTVAFTKSTLSASEDRGTVDLTVELVQSDNAALDVDVAYLGSASSTSDSDINDFSSTTKSFSNSDGSGTQKTVTISLNNDSEFEGAEKAVFQLQNNTAGAIISPELVTLTIPDDDTPDIVINEFLADPPDDNAGDANGDGTRSGDDDEFVEIVNNETTDIDISGWQLSNDGGGSITYTFPGGTVVPAGRAIVVFGGGEPTGNFGGSIIQITTSLGLTNSNGNVTLLDNNGNVIQDISYGGDGEPNADNNESVTRNEDITGSFEGHTTADSDDDGSAFSPGTKVDGTPFGSEHAIAVRGSEGWRMISSPVQSATFSDLLSEFWMQGINNSDDPSGDITIYSWNETGGGTFSAVSNMNDNLEPGKGYIVYFFEDDEFNTPGIQGGFPKIVDSDGDENNGSVSVSVSANDEGGATGIDSNEGWNLLGNPFDTDLSVTAILDELESVNSSINGNVYVWDHEADGGNGDWITLNDGDLIAPFQAFFVHFDSEFSDNASFDKSSLEANEGQEFYKEVSDNYRFDLELHGEQYFDTYSLEFTEDGSTDLDRYDAYKLFSLNPNSINLYSTQNNKRLQKNVLPRELDSNLEIPLSFDVSGRTSLTFRWGAFENIPDDWDIFLIDNEVNREIDLRTNDEYAFNLSSDQAQINELGNTSDKKGLLKTVKQNDVESRFTLAVRPKIAGSSEEIPESVKLNPNYPNPFNPSTTLSFELAEDSEVTLSIWNMIGQKVATLVEGMVEAGTHQQTWNASNMPSGMYIARLEVEGEVFIRKMTLIK